MDSHNCLTCRALISTLFFYCWQCRQDRAKAAKDAARRVSVAGMPLGQPLDVLGYLRPFIVMLAIGLTACSKPAPAVMLPDCQESSEPVSYKTGWKRSSKVYRVLDSGTRCFELTYSKPGHDSVVSHACDDPLPSFKDDDGTRGVVLGHTYGFGDKPYHNGPSGCK